MGRTSKAIIITTKSSEIRLPRADDHPKLDDNLHHDSTHDLYEDGPKHHMWDDGSDHDQDDDHGNRQNRNRYPDGREDR